MATTRHKQQLEAYFAHHKSISSSSRQTEEQNGTSTALKKHTGSVSRQASSLSSVSSSGKSSRVTNATSRRSCRQTTSYFGPRTIGKANVTHLPDEILLKIFGYLDVLSLLRAARVCKRWCRLATDNLMWQNIFKRYVTNIDQGGGGESAAAGTMQDLPASHWKKMCITKCSEWRNKRALRQLKKLHPYTGLPKQTETALRESGVTYQLSLVDSQNKEHLTDTRDVYWHSMAACVRWYTLNFLPLRQVRRLRVLACCPLFFDTNGKAVPGSPYQRSLLWESDMRMSDWMTEEHAMGSDDLINLHKLPGDLLLATWKADGEIAFIAASLSYHHLVKRSLLGTSTECYTVPQRKVISDDIDPSYGLHGYKATVELRNMRQSLWSQQFTSLYCGPHDIMGGMARFTLIRHDCITDHTPVPKKMSLPWRTELFKGVVEMVACLDITVLDERGEVFSTISTPVHAKKPPVTGADLEYEGEHHLEIKEVTERATIRMRLGQLDHGKIFVRHLELALSLCAINEWFGTNY